MRYYRLKEAEGDGIIDTRADLFGFDLYRLLLAKRIDDWDEHITLWYEERETVDFLKALLHWPVMSERMMQIVQQTAPNDVEFLPVRVVNRLTGIPLQGYYVGNILNHVCAVDLDRATYISHADDDGVRINILKYAFRRSAVEPFNLFRLDEMHTTIVISQAVKEALESHHITGCDFREVPVF